MLSFLLNLLYESTLALTLENFWQLPTAHLVSKRVGLCVQQAAARPMRATTRCSAAPEAAEVCIDMFSLFPRCDTISLLRYAFRILLLFPCCIACIVVLFP